MTNDELRALADALNDIAVHYTAGSDGSVLKRAADYLRACADAEPVGYVTANGLRSLRQDDATVLLYAHDYLIRPDHVALYTHPAPAAPQAEPQNIRERWNIERQSDGSLLVCVNLHEKGEKCEYEHFVPARVQAEPKREPLSDEQIDVALQTDPEMILALMSGAMTVGEFKAALRRLARATERAHGIGGSDAE